MRSKHWMILVLAAISVPAAAEPARFRVGGVSLQFPIPPGYCVPAGRQIDVAQVLAAGDDQNVTHLTLFACKKGVPSNDTSDYFLIKTPREALLATVDRKTLLDGVGEAFASPAFTEALSSGKLLDQSEQSVTRALGTKVDLTGQIRPLGKDETCAYLGGTMNVTAGTTSYETSLGACITAVGGRVVSVYFYAPGGGSAGVAALLSKAKKLVLSMASTAAR